LTGADVFILLVLLGSTLIGVLRGFIREAVSLVFWILAIWLSWQFGPVIVPHLGGLLANPSIAPWVGRLVILVLVLLVGWLAGMMLSYFTRAMGLGPLDRVIGLLFGIMRGVLLVGLLVIGGELLKLNQEDFWMQSKLIPFGETVHSVKPWVIGCEPWLARRASPGPASSESRASN
jgi:membrane protein required for colicin V production